MQSLYEKKLCTYPRTDSRYLTGDMADALPVLVNAIAKAMPFAKGIAITAEIQQVICDGKVTDHHAIIPTMTVWEADLLALPAGERSILYLIATRLLCAVGHKHDYEETTITMECTGAEFTAKGRTELHPGWRTLDTVCKAMLKGKAEKDDVEKPLPIVTDGEVLELISASVKEGKTSPPKHFTEAICCERGIRNRP